MLRIQKTRNTENTIHMGPLPFTRTCDSASTPELEAGRCWLVDSLVNSFAHCLGQPRFPTRNPPERGCPCGFRPLMPLHLVRYPAVFLYQRAMHLRPKI